MERRRHFAITALTIIVAGVIFAIGAYAGAFFSIGFETRNSPVATNACGRADRSEICSQWRAAEAAEVSAFWARLGVLLGLPGLAGLLGTIYYTRIAVKDASDATLAMKLANDLTKSEQRPWLKLEVAASASLKAVIRSDKAFYGGIVLTVNARNFGNSPALKPVVCVVLAERQGALKMGFLEQKLREKYESAPPHSTVFPGDTVDVGRGIFHGTSPIDASSGDLVEPTSIDRLVVAVGVFYRGIGFSEIFSTTQLYFVQHPQNDVYRSGLVAERPVQLFHLFTNDEIE